MDGAVLPYFGLTADKGCAMVPHMQTLAEVARVHQKAQFGTQVVFLSAPVISNQLIGSCFLPAQVFYKLPHQVIVLMGNTADQIMLKIPKVQFLFIFQYRIHNTSPLFEYTFIII